ncbi:hypothetical protein GCM10022227_37350 [Streptomyces sedi]
MALTDSLPVLSVPDFLSQVSGARTRRAVQNVMNWTGLWSFTRPPLVADLRVRGVDTAWITSRGRFGIARIYRRPDGRPPARAPLSGVTEGTEATRGRAAARVLS